MTPSSCSPWSSPTTLGVCTLEKRGNEDGSLASSKEEEEEEEEEAVVE